MQGARHFRRNKKENEKENSVNQPQQEEPVSFNAHALDLEPGTIMPVRPSLDLTYNDFTRESYEAADKPLVPKKKKTVPFELSETPHTQSEYWDGKSDRRRKPAGQADSTVAEVYNEEPKRQQEVKQTNRQKQKPQKEKLLRKVLAKSEKEAAPVPEETAGAETQKAEAHRESARNRGTGKRQDHKRKQDRPAAGPEHRKPAGGASEDESKDALPESAKESLMRPYWMKK